MLFTIIVLAVLLRHAPCNSLLCSTGRVRLRFPFCFELSVCIGTHQQTKTHQDPRSNGGSQVNYNLLTVNVFMAITGIYQLSRKITAGSSEPELAAASPASSAAVAGAGPQVPLEVPSSK